MRRSILLGFIASLCIGPVLATDLGPRESTPPTSAPPNANAPNPGPAPTPDAIPGPLPSEEVRPGTAGTSTEKANRDAARETQIAELELKMKDPNQSPKQRRA